MVAELRKGGKDEKILLITAHCNLTAVLRLQNLDNRCL